MNDALQINFGPVALALRERLWANRGGKNTEPHFRRKAGGYLNLMIATEH